MRIALSHKTFDQMYIVSRMILVHIKEDHSLIVHIHYGVTPCSTWKDISQPIYSSKMLDITKKTYYRDTCNFWGVITCNIFSQFDIYRGHVQEFRCVHQKNVYQNIDRTQRGNLLIYFWHFYVWIEITVTTFNAHCPLFSIYNSWPGFSFSAFMPSILLPFSCSGRWRLWGFMVVMALSSQEQHKRTIFHGITLHSFVLWFTYLIFHSVPQSLEQVIHLLLSTSWSPILNTMAFCESLESLSSSGMKTKKIK